MLLPMKKISYLEMTDFFVGDGTGYIMIDSSGKQIGNENMKTHIALPTALMRLLKMTESGSL